MLAILTNIHDPHGDIAQWTCYMSASILAPGSVGGIALSSSKLNTANGCDQIGRVTKGTTCIGPHMIVGAFTDMGVIG